MSKIKCTEQLKLFYMHQLVEIVYILSDANSNKFKCIGRSYSKREINCVKQVYILCFV